MQKLAEGTGIQRGLLADENGAVCGLNIMPWSTLPEDDLTDEQAEVEWVVYVNVFAAQITIPKVAYWVRAATATAPLHTATATATEPAL